MEVSEAKKSIEFLDYLSSALKLSLSIAAAPLLLIISQLKVLMAIEVLCVKILVTISILCLIYVSFYQLILLVRVRHIAAVNKLGDLDDNSFSAKYIQVVDPKNLHSEEKLLDIVKKRNVPLMLILFIGWLCAIFTVFLALWS